MTTVRSSPIEIVLQNTSSRIDILVVDSAGNPVDASYVNLVVASLEGTVMLDNSVTIPPVATRIVKPAGTVGQYYVLWGDPTAAENIPTQTETDSAEDLLFRWSVRVGVGSETVYVVQIARITTARTLAALPGLRLRIDKAAKMVSDSPTDPCFLGYTDSMLLEFLWGGLSRINIYQPYPMWSTIDAFPGIHLELLYESALIVGVMSQQLFAIDTDIESWCFAEGTTITRPDGSAQPIEEVKTGDRVVDRRGRMAQVDAAWCEGEPAELIKLKLWGARKFFATPNHEWPVWAWQRTCLCGCGMNVPKPGKLYVHGHRVRTAAHEEVSIRGGVGSPTHQRLPAGYEPVQRMRAEDIRAGDFLMMPRKFDEISTDVTKDEARLLGYYAAEGHVSKNAKGEGNNLSFTFGAHERGSWVKDVERIVAKLGASCRIDKDARGAALHVTTRCGKHAKRNLKIDRIVELALTHVGEYAKEKCLSEEVMRWPLELKRELIKGMFRGDGCQSWSVSEKKGNVGRSFAVFHSTSSTRLHDQVQLILAQLGYPSRLTRDKARNAVIGGRVVSSSPCYKSAVPAPYAFELADMIWERASLTKLHPHGRKGWKMPRPECMVDDDYIYIPVKSVTAVSNRKSVFNMTVSGDHSFLVGGVATYNSDQGNTFVINHQPKLAAFLNQLLTELDKRVPDMKRHYVDVGTVRVEQTAGLRLTMLAQSAPFGSSFRNVVFSGG